MPQEAAAAIEFGAAAADAASCFAAMQTSSCANFCACVICEKSMVGMWGVVGGAGEMRDYPQLRSSTSADERSSS